MARQWDSQEHDQPQVIEPRALKPIESVDAETPASLTSRATPTSDTTASRATSRRYAFGQPVRLWLYVGVLVAGGLAVVFGPLRLAAPIATTLVPGIPWWAVGLLAMAGELASVELPIHRTNVVLSLNDAVIVIALMGTGPFVTALAVTVSLALVQAAQRRKAERVIFNFGAQLLAVPVYYVVLHTLVEPGAIFSLRSVSGYLVAVTVVSAVSNIEVLAAMYLSEADASVIREGLVFSTPAGALIALGTAVIAMVILVMIVAAPAVLLTLPILVLLTVAAYRAQISASPPADRHREPLRGVPNSQPLQQRCRRRRRLSQSHRGDVPCIAGGIDPAPAVPENPALLTRCVDGVAVDVMAAVTVESLPTGLVETLAASDILVTKKLGLDTPLARYLASGDRPMAMAVALPGAGDARSLGYLVVGQRNKFVGDFQRTDLQLLGTLAEQLAAALQNGRLHEDLALLAGAQDELERRAFHDPLTDLANRALIIEHIEGAFHRAERSGDLIFLLYVDLDGFKGVNDTLGHDAGDELLVKVASRLNECVRNTDTVAARWRRRVRDLVGTSDVAPGCTRCRPTDCRAHGKPISSCQRHRGDRCVGWHRLQRCGWEVRRATDQGGRCRDVRRQEVRKGTSFSRDLSADHLGSERTGRPGRAAGSRLACRTTKVPSTRTCRMPDEGRVLEA